MKTLFLLASVIGLLVLVCTDEVLAQRTTKTDTSKAVLPKFRKDTPYRTVREKLVTLGWEPVTMPSSTQCGDDERCQGFPEVYFCSGVGRAICQYMWAKKDTLIMIYARGEGDQLYDTLVVSCQRLYPTQVVDPYTCRSESEQKRFEEQKARVEKAKDAQTSSMVGTVIDKPMGVCGVGKLIVLWSAIVIEVANKKYYVATYDPCVLNSGKRVAFSPKQVGTIEEVGRTVRVFYSKIIPGSRTTRLNMDGQPTVYNGYEGELTATKIVEVKK